MSVYRKVLAIIIAALSLANAAAQTSSNEFGYTTPPTTTSASTAPVGSPQGVFNVSPLGSATYTVSIEAPQGLTGIQPSIAIVYNSQAGNGIAGYGCYLSGISVITRGPRTIYHDGKAGGITHTKDDAFYLDGQRLVLREHIEGSDSSVYCLENNPYLRIVLHGLTGGTQSNMWFGGLDADGMRYEYGRLGGQQEYFANGFKVNAWYITRVENSVGNYMTYSYMLDNNYLYPLSINYGSNIYSYTGLDNKIELGYEERSNDPIPFSIEGTMGSVSKRLKTITTKTGNNVYRHYTLNYSTTTDYTNTKFSRLTSVNVANDISNGESMNPIVLSWEGLPAQSIQTQALSVSTTIPGGVVDHEKSYYSCGDLNGDGLTDIFEKGYGHPNMGDDYSFYRLHTAKRNSDGNIGFDIDTWLSYGDDYIFDEDLYSYYFIPSAIDIDGDGICEMGIPQQTRTPTENYIGFRFYGENGYKAGFRYNKATTSNDKYCYGVGDFNNDGKCEVAIIEHYETSGYYVGAVMGAETLNNTFTRPFHFTLSYEPIDLYVADMNLDGLADIIVIHQNGYTIYWNDGTWLDSHTTLCTPSQTTESFTNNLHPARAFPGDFNGDGIIDFLITVSDNGTWYLELGKGDGTFIHKTACTINAYEQSMTVKDDNQLGCYVYDIDADGKSDAVICKGMYLTPDPFGGFDKTYTYWLRSTGDSLQQVKMSTSTRESDARLQYYMTGDFNGDGLPELVNYDYDCYNGNNANENPAWHIYPNTAYTAAKGKLSYVTNGFGATTNVAYKSLTDNSVYSPNTQTEVTGSVIVPCPPVLHVVSSTSSDDGAAGQQTVNYQYGGLKAHLQGKGLLGMSYTKASNTTQGTATVSGVSRWDSESLLPQRTYTKQLKGSDSLQTVTRYTISKPYAQKSWFVHPDTLIQTDMDGNVSSVISSYVSQYGYLYSKTEQWNDGTSIHHTYYDYDRYGSKWLPSNIEVERYVQGQTGLSTWTHLEYNSNGHKTLLVTDSYSTKPLTHAYTYDACGNLYTETVSGSGVISNTKTYGYDSTKRFVTSITEVSGSQSLASSFTFDTWGNLLSETNRTAGNNPLTTNHTYDGWGNRIRTELPTGQASTFSRGWGTTASQCYFTVEQGTATPWVKTWYDRSGRKMSTESRGVTDLSITNTWTYDERGRVTATAMSKGSLSVSEQITYDGRDRLLSHSSSTGSSETYSYGNRSVTVNDGANRSYTKTYDSRGNLLTSSDPSGTVTYTNNADGKPLSVAAHGATVNIDYDDRGNRRLLTDPDAGTMNYEYDALGRVISQTDARDSVTTFTYDGFGNLTATAINGRPYASYTYSYTGTTAGLLMSESAGGATVSYTYDSYDRLATNTYSLPQTIMAQSLQYSYTYGTNGLVQSIIYPGSLTVGYNYDCYGNKISTTSAGTTVWALTSDNGKTSVVTHTNNIKNRKTLDSRGYLQQLYMINSYGGDYQMDFTYNGATGNLTERWNLDNNQELFTYDALDRLTSAGSQSYTYASNGNLTYKTGMGHYTYGSNKPHAVTAVENTAGLMALYRMDTDYNAFGKISRIKNYNNSRCMDFLYGPDDERYCTIQRYGDGSLEHEVIYLDGLDLWIDWDGYQRWTYYPEDHVITQKTNSGTFSHCFTFTDQVGNILKAVDANGIEKFSATYDPWGRQTVTLNQIGLIRGYTGHEVLTEYDLINMNGRLYDPLLGRFLSTDNFVQEPGSTQSFNRYSYCLNNPLKYNDPSGELWWMPVLANICFGAAESYGNHEGLWKGALNGVATSTMSMATSYATMGIGNLFGHCLDGVGTELLRAGTHGLLNGAVNSIEGKNFGAGFVSGAAASLLASGAQALGGSYGDVLASSMVGGAMGSGLMGGSWIDGGLTGMNIAMYNHGWKYINGEWTYELDEVVVESFHAMLASYKPMEPGLQIVSPEFYFLFGGGGIWGMVKSIFSAPIKQSSPKFARQKIKNWLGNVDQMSPSKLRSDLKSAGFNRASPYSQHYKRGDITIRLDNPDSSTPYNHMHIEVGPKGNKIYYDTKLNRVDRRSPDAHIRIR